MGSFFLEGGTIFSGGLIPVNVSCSALLLGLVMFLVVLGALCQRMRQTLDMRVKVVGRSVPCFWIFLYGIC